MRSIDHVITLWGYSFRVLAHEDTQTGAIIILDQQTGTTLNSKHYDDLEELNVFLEELYKELAESINTFGEDNEEQHRFTLEEYLLSEVNSIG